MTRDRIVVLAVTKMLSGMCTGGISLYSGEWVRPVREFGTIMLGDLTYKDKSVMRPLDIVEFSLLRPRPMPPHREDWVCDFVRARPACVRKLTEPLEFLQKHSQPEAPGRILRAEQSLALTEPGSVEALFEMDNYSGKYTVKMRVEGMGERPVAVTDIKWRALGRKILNGREKLTLSSDEIKKLLGVERIFIALGLSRKFEGKHWPLVIGVHTWPDYEAEVDYSKL